MMNLAAKSFAISSSMVLCSPPSKRRRRCFTGLKPRWIFKACSATSLGMPGMSEGFHTKMYLLARRKPTSALSYLEESVVPMRTVFPSGLPGSIRTSLEPSDGLKDPVDLLGLGVSSVTSFLMYASSQRLQLLWRDRSTRLRTRRCAERRCQW